jgi:hypothetical protein
MDKEQIADLYHLWHESDIKVFKYKREFLPDEFLVVKKDTEGNLVLDKTNSTIQYKGFNKAHWEYMMLSGEIVFKENFYWHTNVLNYKTGGCTCGAWALNNSSQTHQKGCILYKS